MNKQAAIRAYALAHPQVKPATIAAALSARGIAVTHDQVSTALARARRKGLLPRPKYRPTLQDAVIRAARARPWATPLEIAAMVKPRFRAAKVDVIRTYLSRFRRGLISEGPRRGKDPTPQEIARVAAGIRRQWDERTHDGRLVDKRVLRQPARVPVITSALWREAFDEYFLVGEVA